MATSKYILYSVCRFMYKINHNYTCTHSLYVELCLSLHVYSALQCLLDLHGS